MQLKTLQYLRVHRVELEVVVVVEVDLVGGLLALAYLLPML
jgi:hypothetical protein